MQRQRRRYVPHRPPGGAIVTHKGRSADGGHYVGWVKREDGS